MQRSSSADSAALPRRASAPALKVALAGNPNCGKSSLFNALTGARQRVANYPGVTVERRSGHYKADSGTIEVRDLPGAYSLSAFSPEERIAREEILDEGIDVVVLVVDSTNLKRCLVLLAQVMQLGANPVLCLNMTDEAEKAGQRLDIDRMRQLLRVPVVETIGHRGEGIDELRRAIESAAQSPVRTHRLPLGDLLDRAVSAVRKELEASSYPRSHFDWIATRLLVQDALYTSPSELLKQQTHAAHAEAIRWRTRIEQETGLDIDLFVAERYFGFVDGLLREVRLEAPRADARALSNSIDSFLVHRTLGLPLFAAVMYGIFWLTFTAGEAPMAWIESGFELFGAEIASWWPSDSESLLRSLLVDGIVGGVGGVIVFLPNIALLFVGLTVLEDTGYLARAAFLMDRVMHRFGLHGKSMVPMLTGFGCSIPGIMATRTLENERDRLTTMFVLPLMSCGARLPIWLLLVPAFFAPPWRAPVLWSIYAFGIGVALLLALILRRSVLAGEDAPFVMELPPYRLPTLRAVAMKSLDRALVYLRKAGTIILSISVLMWAMSVFPRLDEFEIDRKIAANEVLVASDSDRGSGLDLGGTVLTPEAVEQLRAAEALRHSIAGRVGAAIEPLVRPLGFDDRLATAMLGAFAAKEVFVAQLGIVYSMGETDENAQNLRDAIRASYPPAVGLSLMVFMLIATPCMATVAVTRRESGSFKWALAQLVGLTVIAYALAFLVFRIGSLFSASAKGI